MHQAPFAREGGISPAILLGLPRSRARASPESSSFQRQHERHLSWAKNYVIQDSAYSSMWSLSRLDLPARNNKQVSLGATAPKTREHARARARTRARIRRKTSRELLAPPPWHDLINGGARSVDRVRLCRRVRGTGSIKGTAAVSLSTRRVR